MGLTLGLETSTGEEVPLWFTRTDSKQLRWHLWPLHHGEADDELVRLATHLHLDLSPLTKITGREEESLESFLARDPTEERRRIWHRDHAAREATWQDPETLISVLKSLVAALAKNPSVFSQMGIDDDYFTEGFFHQDITDLLKMVEWVRDHGAKQVRIVEG